MSTFANFATFTTESRISLMYKMSKVSNTCRIHHSVKDVWNEEENFSSLHSENGDKIADLLNVKDV